MANTVRKSSTPQYPDSCSPARCALLAVPPMTRSTNSTYINQISLITSHRIGIIFFQISFHSFHSESITLQYAADT